MQFEWDDAKARANEEKHGISFAEASGIWSDFVATVPAPRKGEPRFLSVGRLHVGYWTVIWEDCGRARRIISARPATEKERSFYDRERNR